MSAKQSPTQSPQLRGDAEAELAQGLPAGTSARSADELLHELQVHQIELEMQNETLRQTQLALEESRDRYVDLYEFAPVGYLTISHTGLIAEANLTGADLLGEDRRKLIGRRFVRFVVADEQGKWQKHFIDALNGGGKQSFELTLQKSDGTDFATSLDCLPITAGAAAATLRVALTDITLRRAFEDALRAKNVDLENARAVAEKANRAKSEFLSGMSHELRTPLNAVLGFAQLMAAAIPPPSAKQQQSIDQILKAGWYLLGLINEILDLAMIESGRVKMSQESISLDEVIQDCRAMIAPQAERRGIRMSFPVLEEPLRVDADRTRVKQVLVNLLSNAIKYNRPDGTVVVHCAMSGRNRVRVSVTDSGAGLTPERLAQLFQPFNRLGHESSSEEGTGIGLVVSKQLVEMMGGLVGVESSVGVGSVFWFELAASAAAEAASGGGVSGADEQHPMLPHDSSRQRTLLYVEDNPANLALVEQLIERRSDLKLFTAVDGERGIAMARARRPDVILMDINLPGISGLGALSVLHEDPATAHIPVLALSANAIPRDIEAGMAAGFFGYLTKPIKIDEFMAALDIALRHAAKSRQASY